MHLFFSSKTETLVESFWDYAAFFSGLATKTGINAARTAVEQEKKRVHEKSNVLTS